MSQVLGHVWYKMYRPSFPIDIILLVRRPSIAIPNPILGFVLAQLTYILTLALTHPSSSSRFTIFFLMLCYLLLCYAPSSASVNHRLYANYAGSAVFSFLLSYVDGILLGKWCSDTRGPTSPHGGQQPLRASCNGESNEKETGTMVKQPSSVVERIWWAAGHAWNFRFISTPWEVVNVPPFSRQDRNRVPKKGEFLRNKAAVCVLCLFLLDATTLLGAPPEQTAIMFAHRRVGFFTRLSEVSAQELVIRFVSAVMFYVVGFLIIQTFHSCTAVIMVGLGISEVEGWRPPFGRCLDAWSIRQFWGFVAPSKSHLIQAFEGEPY